MAQKKFAEYQHMTLNPFGTPDGQMSHYREFQRKVYWEKPDSEEYDQYIKKDFNTLIKYVVLLIDPESPFADEKDLGIRMMKVMRVLQIGEHVRDHLYKEITTFGDVVNKMIFQFFKRINSHLYETWFSMKTNIHHMNEYLRKPLIAGKDGTVAADINARRQLSATITELMYDLIELEYQIFPDQRLQKIISERADDDGLGGFAEEFAQEPKYNE